MIKLINKVSLGSRSLLTQMTRKYGELVFTNKIKVQECFDKVVTFRAYDLDGKLVNKDIKYDTE